ncbi:MAG TPA: filamentous hemagglutinin N-terminal domain-containing protein [Nevskiaceae bacterium]|nr:filamentous hemagglutinin N-terminal domain-containing protein [Nevskiaceae bacterium]
MAGLRSRLGLVAGLLVTGSPAFANPQGAEMVAGEALFNASTPGLLEIQQTSGQAIINWQSFSIGAGETVRFLQPDAQALVLNRVLGGDASTLLGSLLANGRVFLVNPAGVLFGAGSRVDVGSLLASTGRISDDDFLAGRYRFEGARAPVVAQGHLSAAPGGFIWLGASRVENHGLIEAPAGSLGLTAASGFTLHLDEAGLISVQIDASTLDRSAGLLNRGELNAAGGRIALEAAIGRALSGAAINNEGIIRATGIAERDGEILLVAEGGDIRNSGLLSVEAADAAGRHGALQVFASGDVELNAGAGAVATAGTLLLIAGGELSVGDLTLANPDRATSLVAFAGGHLRLEGALRAQGASTTLSAGFGERAAGTSVTLLSENGDIEVQGPVDLMGRVDSGLAEAGSELFGAALRLDSTFGSLRLAGPVTVNGTLLEAQAGEGATVGGAVVELAAASAQSGFGEVRLPGLLSLRGALGEAQLADGATAVGGFLSASSWLGAIGLGTVDLEGSIDAASAGGSVTLAGGLVSLEAPLGALDVGGDLRARGRIGTVQTGAGAQVGGLLVDLETGAFGGETPGEAGAPGFGELWLRGTVDLLGEVGSVEMGENSGVIGASLLAQSTNALRWSGPSVSVTGRLGPVAGGGGSFVLGALAFGVADFADLDSAAALQVDASLGPLQLGDFAEVSGALLWLESIGGSVDARGGLRAHSSLSTLDAGFGLSYAGTLAYLGSFFGSTEIRGPVQILSSAGALSAGAGSSLSGAQLLVEGFGQDGDGGASLAVDGVIEQSGALGTVTLADADSSALYDGAVLLDAGSGSVFFRDIRADNLFVYFDSDSALATSTLTIGGYAEIVGASVGPRLSAESLELQAGEVFLSADLDIGRLSLHSLGSLQLFLSEIEAGSADLQAGADLRLNAVRLAAAQLALSGERVYLDGDSRLLAGALDIQAAQTLLSEGRIEVGEGLALGGADAALLARLQDRAPALLPASPGPNACLSAPTLALAHLSLAGDYLVLRSDFLFLGTLELAQPGTLVHLAPLNDLPLFTEAVSVTVLGEAQGKVPVNRGRIQPGLGSFGSLLGERPQVDASLQREAGLLTLEVGEALPSLAELVLGSGLAGNRLVIGGGEYASNIQVSDQLAVDVRPTETDFIFLTRGQILGSEQVRTAGQVLILDGTPLSVDQADLFYASAAAQLLAREQASLAPDEDEDDDEEEGQRIRRSPGGVCR